MRRCKVGALNVSLSVTFETRRHIPAPWGGIRTQRCRGKISVFFLFA